MGDMDYSDWGREIGEKINKFVNSREIKDLQENIRTTVEKTMGDVGRSVKEATDYFNKNVEIRWDNPGRDAGFKPHNPDSSGKNEQSRGAQNRNAQSRANAQSGGRKEGQGTAYSYTRRTPQQAPVRTRQLPVERKPEGRVSGVLLIVFGTIGAVLSWASVLFGYFLTVFTNKVWGFGTVSMGFAAAMGCICLAAVFAGVFLRCRVRRFRKYVQMLGIKDFYPVEDMAKGLGRKTRFVIRDLKKMIKRGWFPEGHLDDKETCFILTGEAYGKYQEAQKELERQREEAQRREREQEIIENDPILKQLRTTVEEGKEYIRRIRKVNDDIPGEEISQKLFRLEKVTSRIFEHIESNPDKLSDIRRFMNYYLPTTLKLVEAYHEFSVQPVQGENIRSAEREIEGMLDEINGAFEKLFDQLFADDAMDISTDISVMSAMLAQEGLLESEFLKKEDK